MTLDAAPLAETPNAAAHGSAQVLAHCSQLPSSLVGNSVSSSAKIIPPSDESNASESTHKSDAEASLSDSADDSDEDALRALDSQIEDLRRCYPSSPMAQSVASDSSTSRSAKRQRQRTREKPRARASSTSSSASASKPRSSKARSR